MDKKTASRIAGGNSAYGRAKSDFYPTPSDVTYALLNFLLLPMNFTIWEPAAGEGHMVRAIESRGYTVIGSDILTGTDYLTAPKPKNVKFIITNPPFSLAEEFIRRSAEHGVPFAMLLKSQYWHAQKRHRLFWEITPSYVLPLTWRPDFLFKTRGGGSPLMDVMWCVWTPDHTITDGTNYCPLKRPAEGGDVE